MSTERTFQLKFGYENSSQKRTYAFSDVTGTVVADAKDKIIAINQSLTAGSDSSLASFFVDDNGNHLKLIEEATYIVTTETPLDLGGE